MPQSFVPTAHAHHPSTGNDGLLPTYAPPVIPAATFRYNAPHYSASSPPFLNPDAHFSPQGIALPHMGREPMFTNGNVHSRPMSQGSSGPRDLASPQGREDTLTFGFEGLAFNQSQSNGDAKRQANGAISGFPGHPYSGVEHQQPVYPTTGPPGQSQELNPFVESALIMREWIMTQFGRVNFADYNLDLIRDGQTFFSFPIHSIVVARSPTLMAAISNSGSTAKLNNGELPALSLELRDRFLVDFAFRNALEYLYGAPLPYYNGIAQSLPPEPTTGTGQASDLVAQAMNHALGLLASGFFLHIEEIKLHGLAFAQRLLRWDTLERALAFALDGGLSMLWSMRGSSNGGGPVDLSPNKPTYGEFSSDLLHGIVEFIARWMPLDFSFVPTAPQLVDSPRLPLIVESRPSTSNVRLSRIQFGEVPLEQPGFVDSTLSAILITLPFPALKAILEHGVLR